MFAFRRFYNGRRRRENLCPVEYESCWCEYTNPKYANEPESITNIGSYSPAIMINCNFHQDESNTKILLNKSFDQIPKMSSSSSIVRQKHLSSITHLDLSRTEIFEFPSDAFQGLDGLETIVAEHCKKLTIIRMFAFRNLPQLKTLIIANNPNLIDLEPHSFGSLKNLNFLSLVNNKLSFIDGYVFSTSWSIKIIDLIGNPLKRIKSHAFDGLRNVTDLLISIEQKKSPIETIEGDAFISTAFVDNLFLDGISAKLIKTNTFRGLSYCKNLHLSNSFVEEIEPNAFFRTNNIENLNLKNSKLKFIHKDAFKGIFNIKTIDLRGNYLRMINRSSFEQLIAPKIKREKNIIVNETLRVFDIENKNFVVDRILFEQNPIQCDCNLKWILDNKLNQEFIQLPEICAGPRGYDCLRVQDLDSQNLNCDKLNSLNKLPCEDIIFDATSNMDAGKIFDYGNTGTEYLATSEEKKQVEDQDEYVYEFEYPRTIARNDISLKMFYSTTSVTWSKEKQTNEQESFLKGLLNQSLGL
ncbi:leucine-rich repeat-containing 15 isoform X1, partial [Brachionus plicatilis]